MSEKIPLARKTYFGVIAVFAGVVSILFMGASYGIVYLNISPSLFSQLNNLTALIFCISTPLTFILGVIGYIRKNDSKLLSLIAIVLVALPFAILFVRFVFSFSK